MESLHKGIKWRWRIGQIIILLILFLWLYSFNKNSIEISLGQYKVYFIAGIVILIIGINELFVWLTYKNFKYEFRKLDLHIEKGVIIKRYYTLPYSKIQNIDIERSILARIFGFSSIRVQTAGYSGQNSLSEGYLPAVSKEGAIKIKDFLSHKLSL